MNAELEALLTRIEAAGGPVSFDFPDEIDGVGIKWPTIETEHRIQERTELIVQDYEDDWPETTAALLIHALKLHARQHNTWFELEYPEINPTVPSEYGVSSFTVHEGGQGTVRGLSFHEDEATAYCLAWLAAFEEQGQT